MKKNNKDKKINQQKNRPEIRSCETPGAHEFVLASCPKNNTGRRIPIYKCIFCNYIVVAG